MQRGDHGASGAVVGFAFAEAREGGDHARRTQRKPLRAPSTTESLAHQFQRKSSHQSLVRFALFGNASVKPALIDASTEVKRFNRTAGALRFRVAQSRFHCVHRNRNETALKGKTEQRNIDKPLREQVGAAAGGEIVDHAEFASRAAFNRSAQLCAGGEIAIVELVLERSAVGDDCGARHRGNAQRGIRPECAQRLNRVNPDE